MDERSLQWQRRFEWPMVIAALLVGRILSMVVMLTGIGFVALITAYVADRFIRQDVGEETEEREDRILTELRQIRMRLDRLEG